MKRLVGVAVTLLLLGSGTAFAQEGGDGAPRLAPLDELTARAHAKTLALYARGVDPGADREALRAADLPHLAWFIGTLRMEADRTLRAVLTGEAAAAVLSLPVGADRRTIADSIAAVGLDPMDAWVAEGFAGEWLEFAAALETLTIISSGLSPHRVCPVLGDYWFVDDWGNARPGDRSHKGTDITGPRGTPILAIEAGVVVQANWHRQGGRQIYVRADSSGDIYYYAHLDSWEKWIWTGTRVEAGDVMGRLGSSGNADSPHLHFGWMPGSGRVELDNLQNPYPLLLEICPDNNVPEWVSAEG
ncbi:MAG TPA: M23 family metallopeptidase [Acidimicrobiia bacterium]|nr:M23 family metallopeptidase [Acidimicrobiia bacterium]